MIRTIRENKLILAVVIASLLNVAGGGLGVVMSWKARQENCDHVREAFDAFTTALASASQATPDRVQHFRDAYEPELEKCS